LSFEAIANEDADDADNDLDALDFDD